MYILNIPLIQPFAGLNIFLGKGKILSERILYTWTLHKGAYANTFLLKIEKSSSQGYILCKILCWGWVEKNGRRG